MYDVKARREREKGKAAKNNVNPEAFAFFSSPPPNFPSFPFLRSRSSRPVRASE